MPQWKFRISGKVTTTDDDGETKSINITAENIVTLLRISDYRRKNMPTMLIRVNLDKNNYDTIIKNATNTTMHLLVEKYVRITGDGNNLGATYEPYLEDDYSIFISNDINYNKEVDYPANSTRKDVYKEAYIGLVSKACIDANKNVANATIHNTDMMNLVASYMTSLHLLIEPFNHNPTNQQLIIPPKDTLVQIVEYLNSISVFYDTKYLFFIDEPYCTYLISRSGKGLERADQIYNDVVFRINSTNSNNLSVPGLEIDKENQRYIVDINVLDTRYTIDHDTAKIIDRFESIINPNELNVANVNENIIKVQKYINTVMNNFNMEVYNFLKKAGAIPERLGKMAQEFNSKLLDKLLPLTSYQNKAVSAVKDMIKNQIPTSVGIKVGDKDITVDVISDSVKDAFVNKIAGQLDLYNLAYKELAKLCDDYNSQINNNKQTVFYRASTMHKYLGGVTYINAQDAIPQAKKEIAALSNATGDMVASVANNIMSRAANVTDFSKTAANLPSPVVDVYKTLNSVQTGQYGSYLPSSLTNNIGQVGTMIEQFNEVANLVNQHCNIISGTLTSLQDITNEINKISGNLAGMTGDLDAISKLDIKSKFVGVTVDTRVLNDTTKQVSGTISDIIETTKNMSKNGLSFKDLNSIKKNLSKVADISDIGKLGISKFSSDLNIGGCFGNSKLGVKIIKSKNDNPNEIKNIKSELETMVNRLTVNKYDLDPSIFTPNMKYTVQNYDAHANKDGIFILNKKTEIFVRDDGTFTCNCMLELSKVPDESTTDKSESAQKSNTNETNSTDWYKQATGDTVDSDKSVVTSDGQGVLTEKISPRAGEGSVTGNTTQSKLGTISITDYINSKKL